MLILHQVIVQQYVHWVTMQINRVEHVRVNVIQTCMQILLQEHACINVSMVLICMVIVN